MKIMKPLIIVSSILYASLLCCVLYFNNSSTFLGQVGDFIGGLLNPLLSLLTLVAVFITIKQSLIQSANESLHREISYFREKKNSLKFYKENVVIEGFDVYGEIIQRFKDRYISNGFMDIAVRLITMRPLSEFSKSEKEFIMKNILIISEENEYENSINKYCQDIDQLEAINKFFDQISGDNESAAYNLMHDITAQYKQKNELYSRWSQAVKHTLITDENDIASYIDSLQSLLEYIETLDSKNKETAIKRLLCEVSNIEVAMIYFLIIGNFVSDSFVKYWENAQLYKKLNSFDVCQIKKHWYLRESDIDELYKLSKKDKKYERKILIST